jgi:CheY-like chemotaxis protein
MDWDLPEMSGAETAAAIRRAPSGPVRLPIVCMTGHALAEQDASWVAAGMVGLLAKPFRITDLREVLARWLPGPSSEGVH